MKAKKFKHLFLLVTSLGLICGRTTFGQEVQYSQFYTLLPALNPASTGAFGGDYRFLADYRSSNYSASDPLTTIFASWDQGVGKYRVDDKERNSYFGYGLSFLNDKAGYGNLKLQEINLSLSYTLRMGTRNWLTFGMRLGMATRQIDYSGLSWGTQWNDGEGTYDPTGYADPMVANNKATYNPISSGLMWNYSDREKLKFNLGLALNRLNQPDAAFDGQLAEKLPMQLVINAGAEWMIPNTVLSLMPSVLYMSQDYSSQVSLGTLVKWYLSFDSKMTHIKKSSALYAGVFYRTSGDLILTTKFELRRNMALGLSYDIDMTAVSSPSTVKQRSAFELVFTYAGFFKERSLLPKKGSIEFF